MKKSGGLDLSVSTIVIVVLAVSFLIMGLVMVQKLMCGTIKGVQIIDEKSREEILRIFTPDEKLVIKERSNEITKGIGYGVGFAIRNDGSAGEEFSYEIKVSDIGTCKFSQTEALSYITTGKNMQMSIASGEDYIGLINFDFPKTIENCKLRYGIDVKSGESVYSFKEFDVSIISKSFTKNIC